MDNSVYTAWIEHITTHVLIGNTVHTNEFS